jgi:hypothetical protein
MARLWNHDDRWHDRENNIAFSSSCHHSFIISYHRIFTIVTTSFIMVPSHFYHRALAVSPSYNRCFTIVQSLFHVRAITLCFHNRTIAFSSRYHRAIALLPLNLRESDLVRFSVRLQDKSINFLNLRYYN